MDTTTIDTTIDSSINNLQTKVGAEELSININSAKNIDTPENYVIDGNNVKNNENDDLETVLKKLSKFTPYRLNHKCYYNIKGHGRQLLGI